MILAGVLLVVGLQIRSKVNLRDIDSLDFPHAQQDDAVLPDRVFVEPFVLVVKMLAVALVVTIAVWLLNIFLWGLDY